MARRRLCGKLVRRVEAVVDSRGLLMLHDLQPIREPPGTVSILRSPRSKMGLSPSPRRFSDRLLTGSCAGILTQRTWADEPATQQQEQPPRPIAKQVESRLKDTLPTALATADPYRLT